MTRFAGTFFVCSVVLISIITSTEPAEAKKFILKPEQKQSPLGPKAQVTKSGLHYVIEKPGKGKVPNMGDLVRVHYVGWLFPQLKKFDSTYDKKQAFLFTVGVKQVRPLGLDEAVKNMKVGEERVILIPPSLGFGDKRVGNVPANSTLKYKVKLLEVKKGYRLGR